MSCAVDEVALREQVGQLSPWFQNLHLPHHVQTAPDHGYGDFPRNKWRSIEPHLPADLNGWRVLDVGCNAGFYSFELAKRGAEVTAIDCDPHYLKQARWACQLLGLDSRIRFEQMQVYSVARWRNRFDLVWFMGVFYHLRYPALALDILARATRRLMVFQTLTLPGEEVATVPDDFDLDERDQMLGAGWPKMAFIERRLAGDPTNWWAANHACVEALLRSSGLQVVARPAHEIYLAEPGIEVDPGLRALDEAQYLAAIGTEDS